MAVFLLSRDVNLGIARRLRGHGHELRTSEELSLEPADWAGLLQVGESTHSVVLSHNHQLADVIQAAGAPLPLVLLVPQPSLDDILRVAESVHQLISSTRAAPGTCMRLGLRSGWARLP
jgi:hypothetical protein